MAKPPTQAPPRLNGSPQESHLPSSWATETDCLGVEESIGPRLVVAEVQADNESMRQLLNRGTEVPRFSEDQVPLYFRRFLTNSACT